MKSEMKNNIMKFREIKNKMKIKNTYLFRKSILISILLSLFLLPNVMAYTVGYMVNNPSNLDSRESYLKNFLLSKGNTVQLIDDVTVNVSGYDLVIVSHSVDEIFFDHQHTKTIFMSTKAAKNKGFGSGFGTTSNKEITIDKINFITEKYTLRDLTVYTVQDSMSYIKACFPTNSVNIAYRSDTSKSVLLMLDTNALLIEGSSCSRTKKLFERNLFFGLTEADNWNSDAKYLFERSMVWVVTGGQIDSDSDGYPSIESGGSDCNDNDASVYPNAIDINKNCKNDAPVVISYAPQTTKILENTNKEFSVNVGDDETSNLVITWKINSVSVGSGTSYNFNKPAGDYVVEASISDGVLTTKQTWNIQVRSTAYFSCSEIGGYVCADNYICNGASYAVVGADICCSITCSEKPLEFLEAKKICTKKNNNNIKISFDGLSDDNFYVGELVDFVVEIKNEFDETLDFEVYNSVYDTTKQEESMLKKHSTDINKDETKRISVESELLENLNENNNYALYIYAETDDACNQAYYPIDVKRKANHIVIDYLDFEDQRYVCGDEIEFEIGVSNIGTVAQNIILKLKNNELGIDEEIDELRIEAYGQDDSGKEKIIVSIPDDAPAGSYSITAEVEFNNEEVSLERTLILDECKNIVTGGETFDTISIGNAPAKIFEGLSELEYDDFSLDISSENKKIIIVIYIGLFIVGVAVSFFFLRKKY